MASMMLIAVILLILLSGYLYRKAGRGGFKNAKAIRRFGCPGIRAFLLLIVFADKNLWAHWQFYLSYVMSVGMIWGYWDWLTRLWRHDESEYWENWALHGLGSGLALLPLAWCGIPALHIVLNAILIAGLMVWISEGSDNADVEEWGRGIVYQL